MDKEVLKARLSERFEASLAEAIQAVEQAPQGHWISGSEWEIRTVFQNLMAECFQELLQAKMDAHPSASPAAFSPCGSSGDPAKQG